MLDRLAISGSISKPLFSPIGPVLVLILTGTVAFSQSNSIGNNEIPWGRRLTATAAAIEAYGLRPEGSPAEEQAISYLLEQLAGSGVPYRVRDFSRFEGGHSFSRNVVAGTPERGPPDVVFAVSLANDNNTADATALALGIVLAEHFAASQAGPAVEVLFLGAQHGSAPPYPMGSRLWIQNDTRRERPPVFYLSVEARPARLAVQTGADRFVTPLWMVEAVERNLTQNDVFYDTSAERTTFYHLGISERRSPVSPFLAAEYPAIEIQSGDTIPVEIDSWANRLVTSLVSLAEATAVEGPHPWERHYLPVQIGSEKFIVGEEAYVIGFLGVFLIPLGYALIFQKRGRKYRRILLRDFWTIPILLGTVFVLLTVATLLIQGVLAMTRFPDVWTYAPEAFLLLKLTLPIFLFSLLFHLLGDLPISKKGSFYSAGAVVLLFVDTVATAAINISLAYYFLWAFVFAFLFTLFKPILLKLLCLPVSLYWVIRFLSDATTLAEETALEYVIVSPLWANLLLAFILLPFLFMVLRLNFLIQNPFRDRRNFALRVFVWATGIVTATLGAFVFFYTPFGSNNPMEIRAIEETMLPAGGRSLRVEAPAPPGNFALSFGSETYQIAMTRRTYLVGLPAGAGPVEITVSATPFLGRTRYQAEIAATAPVRRLTAVVESLAPIIVYDVSLPSSLSDDGRRLEVHIGRNPPTPLAFEFTIQTEGTPRVRFVAAGETPRDAAVTNRGDLTVDAAARTIWEGSP